MDNQKHVPIPPVFHSLELGGPFRECLICEGNLLDCDSPKRYMIERIFRGTEPILEYAMCQACHHDMSQQISQ